MTATFEEFLRSGRINSIAVGMSSETVRDILGPPEDVSTSKRPSIWKYGSCQLTFDRIDADASMNLESIIYYFHHQQVLQIFPSTLTPNGWFPSQETTIGEFLEYLNSINLMIVGGKPGSSQQLVLESSARIVYEWGQLWSVGFSNPKEIKMKQLSVTIPLEQFQSLQSEARSRGLSVSGLCAQWIGEHATGLRSHKV